LLQQNYATLIAAGGMPNRPAGSHDTIRRPELVKIADPLHASLLHPLPHSRKRAGQIERLAAGRDDTASNPSRHASTAQ
jgi:hypothetical protein